MRYLRAHRAGRFVLAPLAIAFILAACTPSATTSEQPRTASASLSQRGEMDGGLSGSGREITSNQPSRAAVSTPFRLTAQQILAASLSSSGAWQKLSYLTDLIGPRLSGTAELVRATTWARDTFQRDGHDGVALEPVKVPRWQRGAEAAELMAPISRPLHLIGLGGTVATPSGGITADALVVKSFDELEKRKTEAKGKIVVFNQPWPASENAMKSYGEVIRYRVEGAIKAAPLGAVAVLVRSLASASLGAPHTGVVRYAEPPAKKIPAAALSVEDADLIERLALRGPTPRIHLSLANRTLPDADSANVVAEIRGRDKPGEIVLLAAHIDSWDVGQGAQDDGAGCVIVMQSLTILRELGLVPRRTVRAVLFTNEENGSRGALQYGEDHRDELAHHVAAFEVDSGAGAPIGLTVEGEPSFGDEVRDVLSLLAPIGAITLAPGSPGSDLRPLRKVGVPLFGLRLDATHYFEIHHSAADTLDKIDPTNLKKDVAALATVAFVVAEREGTWMTQIEATSLDAGSVDAQR